MERYSAFEGTRCLANGGLPEIARAVKAAIDQFEAGTILIFDNENSLQVEIDLRGSLDDVLARLKPETPVEEAGPVPAEPRPGRPKLGVVPREVTLLPRHWEWLGQQPGGASVALRKLVEEARRAGQEKDRGRRRDEAVDRFLSAMAGDFPLYEEVTRAYYRRERERVEALVSAWPEDVARHLLRLAYETN